MHGVPKWRHLLFNIFQYYESGLQPLWNFVEARFILDIFFQLEIFASQCKREQKFMLLPWFTYSLWKVVQKGKCEVRLSWCKNTVMTFISPFAPFKAHHCKDIPGVFLPSRVGGIVLLYTHNKESYWEKLQ